jgi:hypothetical protein
MEGSTALDSEEYILDLEHALDELEKQARALSLEEKATLARIPIAELGQRDESKAAS